MRYAEVKRKTKETEVSVWVNLDGSGESSVNTGVSFLDHMLVSFSTHSLVDLKVKAKGDLKHHIVEDVALTLGKALSKALGERKGIRRFGYSIVPMDDALSIAAIDLAKRPYSSLKLRLERNMIEDAPREDLEHFFRSISIGMEATLHINVIEGTNDHHKFEASTKAFALSFRDAITNDPRREKSIPSSKGVM